MKKGHYNVSLNSVTKSNGNPILTSGYISGQNRKEYKLKITNEPIKNSSYISQIDRHCLVTENEYSFKEYKEKEKNEIVKKTEFIISPDAKPEIAETITAELHWNYLKLNEDGLGKSSTYYAKNGHFTLINEFTDEEKYELVDKFIKEKFTDKGLTVEYAICEKTNKNENGEIIRNDHLHLLISRRKLDENANFINTKPDLVYTMVKCENIDGKKNFEIKKISEPELKKDYTEHKINLGKNKYDISYHANDGTGIWEKQNIYYEKLYYAENISTNEIQPMSKREIEKENKEIGFKTWIVKDENPIEDRIYYKNYTKAEKDKRDKKRKGKGLEPEEQLFDNKYYNKIHFKYLSKSQAEEEPEYFKVSGIRYQKCDSRLPDGIDIGKKQFLEDIRKSWADYTNEFLEKGGYEKRITHKSNKKIAEEKAISLNKNIKDVFQQIPQVRCYAKNNNKPYQSNSIRIKNKTIDNINSWGFTPQQLYLIYSKLTKRRINPVNNFKRMCNLIIKEWENRLLNMYGENSLLKSIQPNMVNNLNKKSESIILPYYSTPEKALRAFLSKDLSKTTKDIYKAEPSQEIETKPISTKKRKMDIKQRKGKEAKEKTFDNLTNEIFENRTKTDEKTKTSIFNNDYVPPDTQNKNPSPKKEVPKHVYMKK